MSGVPYKVMRSLHYIITMSLQTKLDSTNKQENIGSCARWQSFESKSARSFTSNIKRHSEGTFTSDFTRYLDKMKAKDFVHWLINTKRYSSTKRYIKGDHNVISFPSDHSLFRSN
ncbi:unnamed protein product [Caretta caretta]